MYAEHHQSVGKSKSEAQDTSVHPLVWLRQKGQISVGEDAEKETLTHG